jgi:hypothetical protein
MAEDAPAPSSSTSAPDADPAGDLTNDKKDRRRKGCLSGVVAGLMSGIISSALVAFALTPTGSATTILVFHAHPRPSCANPQWLLQIPDDDIFANSYFFALDTIPHYGLLHPPDLSVDGSLETAWLQWWPTTNLQPGNSYDYITWGFPHSYHVRLICVVDGWTEDNNTYRDTLPIGAATVYSSPRNFISPPPQSDRCRPSDVIFKDYIDSYAYRWQGVAFSCNTDSVTLRIDGVSAASMKARLGSLVPAPEPPPDQHVSLPLVGLTEVRIYYAPSILSFVPN